MGARCQIPSTRRTACRNPHIIYKQLITGAESFYNQLSHGRRLAALRGRNYGGRLLLPGELERNCLVVSQSHGLARGNVSLEICFDGIGRSRRKLEAAVRCRALVPIYFHVRTRRQTLDVENKKVRSRKKVNNSWDHQNRKEQQHRNDPGNEQQLTWIP